MIHWEQFESECATLSFGVRHYKTTDSFLCEALSLRRHIDQPRSPFHQLFGFVECHGCVYRLISAPRRQCKKIRFWVCRLQSTANMYLSLPHRGLIWNTANYVYRGTRWEFRLTLMMTFTEKESSLTNLRLEVGKDTREMVRWKCHNTTSG